VSGYTTQLTATQDALKAVIESTVTGDVHVSLGFPSGGWKKKSICYIAAEWNVEVVDELTAFSQRQEVLTGEIRVMVEMTTREFVKPRDEAFRVVQQIEDALASDRTLSGLVSLVHVTGIATSEGVDDNTRYFAAAVRVAADARVTA